MTEPRSPFIDSAMPQQRFGKVIFGWVLFIVFAVMLFALVQNKNRNLATISLSEFDLLLRSGSIKLLTIESDQVTGTLTTATVVPDGQNITEFRTDIPAGNGANWPFVDYILQNRGKAQVRVDNNQNLLIQVLVPVIPWILIFCFIWFFVFRHLRKNFPQRI